MLSASPILQGFQTVCLFLGVILVGLLLAGTTAMTALWCLKEWIIFRKGISFYRRYCNFVFQQTQNEVRQRESRNLKQ